MKTVAAPKLKVGSTVRVPWGVSQELEGVVLELWGDPPSHVRVELVLDEESQDRVVVLLPPSAVI